MEEATRRVMSVMFCDVVGSTTKSVLGDGHQHLAYMRAYYDAVEAVVRRYGGEVRQHLGDGLYVHFGHDRPLEDHALVAVRCGLEVVTVLRSVSRDLVARMGESLPVRLGISSGAVVLADVAGESGPLAFGDTASLAFKLQTMAPPGGLVISPSTLRLIGSPIATEVVGRLDLGPEKPALDAHLVVGLEPAHGADREWLSPFVGRSEELEAGASVLGPDGFSPPGRAVLLLTGEAGIGKTRYLAELRRSKPDVAWLATRCERLFETVPGLPFCSLGRELAGIEPGEPPDMQRARAGDFLEQLGIDSSPARVGAFLGLGPDTADLMVAQLDPVAWHALMLGWTLEWLAAVVGTEPTVLMIDDLHNADPTSLRILAALCESDAPLALAVATRGQALPPHPDTGLPLPAEPVVVPLAPLPASSVAALVRQISPVRNSDEVDQIARRSGGLPLFVEQLASIGQTDRLPGGLRDLVVVRLLASGADERVMAVAAVPPSGFDLPLVEEGTGLDRETVRQSVTRLLVGELVAEVGPGHFSYRHEVVREAAHDLLAPEDYVAAHARLAVVLRERGYLGRMAPPAVIADLELKSGNVLAAAEVLRHGATEAQAAGAHREAIGLLSVALQHLDRIEDGHTRVAIELGLRSQRGYSAIATEGYASTAGVEDFDRCLELCALVGRSEELLPLLTASWAYYTSRGDMARSAEVANQLRAIIEDRHDQFRPENDTAFGVLSFFRGDYRSAIDHLGGLRTLTPNAQLEGRLEQAWSLPNDPLAAGLAHLAVVLWATGSPRDGVACADQAVIRAAGLPFPRGPFSLAYAKSWVGYMYRLRGDDDAADVLAQEVIDLGQRHGFVFWHLTGLLQQAIGQARSGDPARAAALEAMIQAWGALGARVLTPYNFAELGRAHLAGERYGEALVALELALNEAEVTGAHFYTAEILRLRGLAHRGRGDESMAVDDLRRAVAHAVDQGALIFALRGSLALAGSPSLPDRAEGMAAVAKLTLEVSPGVGLPELNEAHRLAGSDRP